ncbi:hypothetical protein THIX_60700 [Thiomonas sp. X19]|nr:hypothetical protein THIX_60700 [Thiomonas sp. X19]
MQQDLKLCELIGSLSHALDMAEGRPKRHCVRCAYTGMAVAQGLGSRQRWELYYNSAAQGTGMRQQRRAHLRALPHGRSGVQARLQTGG